MLIHTGSVVRDDYGMYGIVLDIIDDVPLVAWVQRCVGLYCNEEVPLTVLS